MNPARLPAYLNQAAQTALRARGFVQDEALHAYRAEELADLLAAAGLPAFQPLFEMEEELGGLRAPLDDHHRESPPIAPPSFQCTQDEFLAGPVAMMKSGAPRDLRTPSGGILVPIARCCPLEVLAGFAEFGVRKLNNRTTRSDLQIYAIDTQGQVWRIADSVEPFANSYRAFLAKVAVFVEIGLLPRASLRIRHPDIQPLVQGLRLVRIIEASDQHHTFWRFASSILEETPSELRLWAADVSVLVRALTEVSPDPSAVAELFLSSAVRKVLPPSAAPELSSFHLEGSTRLGLDRDASAGWVGAEGSSRVYRIRSSGSRVLEWDVVEGATAGGDAEAGSLKMSRSSFLLATEALAGRVSQRCLDWVRAQGVIRDPEPLLPRDELRRELLARGLPAHPAALDFEEIAGGLWVPGSRGAHALCVTLALDTPDVPASGLVPIGPISGPGAYWMDERGHVLVDDYVEDLTFVAASWSILLERLALGHDYFDVANPPGRFKLSIRENIEENLADRLNGRLLPELSDEYESYWAAGGIVIWRRPRFRGLSSHCVAGTNSVRELVEVIQSVNAISTSAKMRIWTEPPSGEPGERPPEVTGRYPFDPMSEPGVTGEILVRGPHWVEQHVHGRPVQVLVDDKR